MIKEQQVPHERPTNSEGVGRSGFLNHSFELQKMPCTHQKGTRKPFDFESQSHLSFFEGTSDPDRGDGRSTCHDSNRPDFRQLLMKGNRHDQLRRTLRHLLTLWQGSRLGTSRSDSNQSSRRRHPDCKLRSARQCLEASQGFCHQSMRRLLPYRLTRTISVRTP